MLSTQMTTQLAKSAWVRDLFGKGAQLAKEHGAENVFDLSIGNPIFEPPAVVTQALKHLCQNPPPGLHRYTTNAGNIDARTTIANTLSAETTLSFSPEHILLCAGAAAGLNVLFRTICDPDDEIITIAPYFLDYAAYVNNAGGRLIVVASDADFQVDVAALAAAITPRTKAVLINSPNNPTGVVYPAASLAAIGHCLKERSGDQPILLIADEPYRKIVFEETVVPWVFDYYAHAISIQSYSKDLGLAGERIGSISLSPTLQKGSELFGALCISQRTLGFVNAPALMQAIIPECHNACVDLSSYQYNRDILLRHLQALDVPCKVPEGAFYLFPQCPIDDDHAFIATALTYNLILIPGSAFGAPGYFRISYCVENDRILKSLPAFTKLFQHYGTRLKAKAQTHAHD